MCWAGPKAQTLGSSLGFNNKIKWVIPACKIIYKQYIHSSYFPIPQYIKLLTTFIIFATNFFLESVQKVNAPILFSITGIQWLMATTETIHVQSAKTYRCRHDNSTILKYRDIFLKYHQRHGRLSHLEILCLQEITWLRFMLHPWQIRNYGIWFCLLSVLWA